MTKLEYTFKNDTLFKMLFVKYPDLLKNLDFELPKLPKELNANDGAELWLKLFDAETEEEIAEIEKLEVPIMQQAIEAYRSITASKEFQEIERLRSKARHDEAQALHHARLMESKKWQSVIADKDKLIADNKMLIADKDKLIAELRARLEGDKA